MSQNEVLRYPYVPGDPRLGEASLRPILPLTIGHENDSVDVVGLLDTGAMVNVLPYSLGLKLGLAWEVQSRLVRLTGNLARSTAYAVLLSAGVGPFAPVQLAFAWTQADDTPLLLGQVNFFMEFDVCFYRTQLAFDIRPRQA